MAEVRPGPPSRPSGGGPRRGPRHSGIYYVTQVTHSISTDHYATDRGWRNAVGLTGAELFIDPWRRSHEDDVVNQTMLPPPRWNVRPTASTEVPRPGDQ
jgi:hypothetical protein